MPDQARSRSRRFLPPDPRAAEPYRLTPGLALRVGMLGMLAIAVFAVLFLRLWALQVLSGNQYLRAAQDNQLRSVRIPAPRGPILDRNLVPLVTNLPGTAIQIWPADLPKTYRARLYELRRLAAVVRVPLVDLGVQIRKRANDPLTPVTVVESAHEPEIDYLYEHQAEFPGVTIAQTYLRHYPYGTLAAPVLGYVGEISAAQLQARQKFGYQLGDKIGQTGMEARYDAFLRGTDGVAQLRVDSLGRPRSALIPGAAPRAGNALRLTIDVHLQQTAERALDYGIKLAQGQGHWFARGGAIVALDPRDGSILAMASRPTYNPSVFVGRVKLKDLAPLVNPAVAQAANFPALNRAIEGTYPAGSTFKPVTALAALEERVLGPSEQLLCSGSVKIAKQTFHNWNAFVYQWMDLPTALAASCDTFFYQLGYDFYKLPGSYGHPLQAWASRFGFGAPTGVDLGPESSGLLPTPEWLKQAHTKTLDPCCWRVDQLWKPGDSIQLAIGQKDLLVTPLQMARFYALIANGGRLVTPHLLYDVEQPGSNGQPGVRIPVPALQAPQSTNVDAGALAIVQQGLYRATHDSIGTSSAIFGNFPYPIAGKTGTAEKIVNAPGYTGLQNQSWWCGYGPTTPTPEIVVCALIENGGHGGTAAAPAALRVFEKYFHVRVGPSGTVFSD